MRGVFIILPVVLFLFMGCIKPPAEYWQINKERILAVKAYSPQITDESAVILEAVAFSPHGPVEISKIKWMAFSIENVSLYSRGEESLKPAGSFFLPVGNIVAYFPPVTPGTYWVGVFLDDDPEHPTLKQVERVTETTNRNPIIRAVKITPSRVVSPEEKIEEVRLEVDATDPDGDSVTYSWFVVNGSLSGCTKRSEVWNIEGLKGYNQIFVVARDRRGGIDWKMAEIYAGKKGSASWIESGGMLYPLPSTSSYPSVFTYSVEIYPDSSERGFHINFLKPVTDENATSLARWYLGFTTCNPCNMEFHLLENR